MDRVAIIGTGCTKFGELFTSSYADLLVEACRAALKDAGVTKEQIGAAWLGTYMPYAWNIEGNAGSSLADPLGITGIPVTRVANYCCTGMEAVRNAAFAVQAGAYDLVLACGVEKMRDVPARGSLVAQHVEKGHPLYCKGRTAPGMFALMATKYFETFGIGTGTLDKVAVKNHYNGSLNARAHFRKAITPEAAAKGAPVAEPLRMFDCCPTTDGAAAVVLCKESVAKQFTDDYVIIAGMGASVHGGYFNAQMDPTFDFLGFPATREASAMAYKQSGVTKPMDDIDVAECHDCFTITEILNYEDLGFVAKGEGHHLIEEGITSLDGSLPVNTSGGLKSMGHPIGASGVRMIVDVCDQLQRRAGERQVQDAHRGLAHTLGGPGVVSCVFVLEKD